MTDEVEDVLLQLDALRFTPDRSDAVARSGLQNFLDEAQRLRPASVIPPTVSARLPRRLTGWIPKLTDQERPPMLALAIKVVLVLAVLLGGTGVTAAAAQSSLPNETLYPVKLFIEDMQSGLAATPDAQIDVQLDHAQQRVREMAQLAERGVEIPTDVPIRLQTQLQTTLQLAAQLDDQAMPAALDRIQLRTQDQLRQMDQLHLNDAAQALTQTREMAQLGQRDPQAFRGRFGHGQPTGTPPQPQRTPQADPSHTPQASRTPQSSPTPPASRTPQPSCTPQLQRTGTPQGHSYGPGQQSTPQSVATPVGQGDGHEYGPGPQTTPQGSGGNGSGSGSGGNGSGGSGSGSGSGGSGSGGSGSGNGSGSGGGKGK